MDAALSLTGGCFVAAAKLVDMEPVCFKNRVSYHPELKAKWGRKSKGRPKNLPAFRIVPFDAGANTVPTSNPKRDEIGIVPLAAI